MLWGPPVLTCRSVWCTGRTTWTDTWQPICPYTVHTRVGMDWPAAHPRASVCSPSSGLDQACVSLQRHSDHSHRAQCPVCADPLYSNHSPHTWPRICQLLSAVCPLLHAPQTQLPPHPKCCPDSRAQHSDCYARSQAPHSRPAAAASTIWTGFSAPSRCDTNCSCQLAKIDWCQPAATGQIGEATQMANNNPATW